MSEFPILVIQYHERLSLYPIKVFLIIIATFLTISAFIVVGYWLSTQPLSALQNRILQPDFWHFPRSKEVVYFDENRFSVESLLFIIMFLSVPTGMVIPDLVWTLFGIIEYRAFPEKLIVKYQLLGMSRTHLIPRDSLLNFKKYKVGGAQGTSYYWVLKAITNQKRFFFWRSEITLLSHKPMKYNDWLESVLADFYQV
ncbi:hypothetical protein IQ264_26465 [Phormidium sp. LEGE 05292]|uniref:hypothetical protein n=1 Tax=[Phormidium] sp. LEGE 05292 TaxID=767427 RepID=UPI0018822311|nr:hypothetical protein [Phormidium sp. LEGE 05292]MBE9228960.1 hypothetical protein [Phormidium sp. LEGE 05292]